jgi:hypothetical protein
MTITVEIDGETHEVDESQIQTDGVTVVETDEDGNPQGYVQESVHEAQVSRAENNATEGMVPIEEAAQREEVISTVLEEHGDRDIDPDSIREQIEENEVAPLRERLQARDQAVVRRALLEAAQDLGVQEEFRRGENPYIFHEFGDRLEFDEDRGRVVAVDEDGNLMAGEDGVAGPRDLLQRQRDSDQYSHLFGEPSPQSGGGSRDPSSGDGGGSSPQETFTRSEIQEMSPQEYAENKEAINRAMENDNIRDE